MNEIDILKISLSRRIAGEILISENHTESIKKWREIFNITQRELADEMGVMPSVISDYESNRRKNPGLNIIKNMIDSMLKIDEKRDNVTIKGFSNDHNTTFFDNILDSKEFSSPLETEDLIDKLNGRLLTKGVYNNNLTGFLIVNSKKVINSLSLFELLRLQVLLSNKIVVFTDVESGKKIISMFKLADIKPGMILLHGIIRNMNDLSIRISQSEKIPLGVCSIASIDKLEEKLKEL